jgi:hypothetical protein
VFLAGIQEEIQARSKFKGSRPPFPSRVVTPSGKENRELPAEGELWKARQLGGFLSSTSGYL